jgi:hypothetical protein
MVWSTLKNNEQTKQNKTRRGRAKKQRAYLVSGYIFGGDGVVGRAKTAVAAAAGSSSKARAAAESNLGTLVRSGHQITGTLAC